MSYIDYNMANLDNREVFSCTKNECYDICKILKNHPGVLGAVLIATCNRTELYLSLDESVDLNPFRMLCVLKDLNYNKYRFMSKTLRGQEAIRHLYYVAAGTQSQIWGDAQIISQVREAIYNARQAQSADGILNVLFRTAVTAGKKVKTLVDFKLDDNSTATRAVNLIKDRDDLNNILIIGNGMIGRLVGNQLARYGKNSIMTLRQYKYGAISVPRGVNTINYSDRYEKLEEIDAVISATLSPHHTLDYDKMKDLNQIPKLFIDLAVPRDIDPKIEEIKGIEYYDIDDISKDVVEESKEEQMKEISEIVDRYEEDFYRWYEFRRNIKEKEKEEAV